jgi:hypothetical protein
LFKINFKFKEYALYKIFSIFLPFPIIPSFQGIQEFKDLILMSYQNFQIMDTTIINETIENGNHKTEFNAILFASRI